MNEKLNLVPVKNNIRIKPQGEQYIIFNLETSGFHAITEDSNAILERVNGELTIGELAKLFATERNLNLEELENDFISFFDDLVLRKIITLK